VVQQDEARIAALERLVGKQALELEFLRRIRETHRGEKRAYIRNFRPAGGFPRRRMPADGNLALDLL
jgi:transposase